LYYLNISLHFVEMPRSRARKATRTTRQLDEALGEGSWRSLNGRAVHLRFHIQPKPVSKTRGVFEHNLPLVVGGNLDTVLTPIECTDSDWP
jgi:hypothetical protein